jgi:hypothetical protein
MSNPRTNTNKSKNGIIEAQDLSLGIVHYKRYSNTYAYLGNNIFTFRS